jgi:hypothetical protein
MARTLGSGFSTHLGDMVVYPAVFFEGEFASGTVRLWSGLGDKSWNGFTWSGAGTLLGIGEIQESTDLKASGFSVSLSGMSSAVVAKAMELGNTGKKGTVYFAAFDAAGNFYDTPIVAWQGRLDQPVIDLGAETATVGMQYEGRLIDLNRSRVRRLTNEDQQIGFPGDLFFQHVAALQNQTDTW